jgi:hypothetical protein
MRVGVAVVGGLLAVAGIVLESPAIVWVAIGVLGVAFVLRFVAERPSRSGQGDGGNPDGA